MHLDTESPGSKKHDSIASDDAFTETIEPVDPADADPAEAADADSADVADSSPAESIALDRARLLDRLQDLCSAPSLEALRTSVTNLSREIKSLESPVLAEEEDGQCVMFAPAYLEGELEQIALSRTLNRAQYYVERLIKSISEVKPHPINDINLNRWKEYAHIETDSLWVIEHRDRSGVHKADYWGNFIPQIPRQMMLRYTKKGDWVLDAFSGAGTTLIEGQRLGRHTLGIELQPDVAATARRHIRAEPNHHDVVCEVITADSQAVDYPTLLARYEQRAVQLVILHPPYFDIIQFSDDPRDLSNAASVDQFLQQIGRVTHKAGAVLESDRYLVLVIGDTYSQGEWIPLGFLTMNQVLEQGFRLKSIVVKNFERTMGKRNQSQLWRYRALVGGFYIFKHEYIFVFQKL